jgi:hypothetical protein
LSVPTPTDIASVSAALGEALERTGIRYFVGGSVASSVHGAPRFTRDLDVVVDFSEAQVPAFVAAAGPDFDIDEETLREEARRRGSWNIFHVPSMLKIDLFFLKGDPFSASQLARRVALEIVPGKKVYFASPEDTILRKLLWHREGNESSAQQIPDVVAVLKMKRGDLDVGYLDHWAARLGVVDLLAKARSLADQR